MNNKMELLILAVISSIGIVNGQFNCQQIPECLYAPKIGESLPVTEEEIQEECRDLRQFQDCVQEWGKACLRPEAIEHYNTQIEKPLKFVKALCGNQKFRQDYLDQKESFQKLAGKWKSCISLFQKEENATRVMSNGTQGNTEICCGLHSFKECTEKLCSSDCTSGTKEVLGRIIDMTKSSYDIVDCKDVDIAKCPATSGSGMNNVYSLLVTLLPILTIFVLHH